VEKAKEASNFPGWRPNFPPPAHSPYTTRARVANCSASVLGEPNERSIDRSIDTHRAFRGHVTEARGSVVVEVLCYKSEGRGLEIFLATPGLGVYSASNRNEYHR
jgi:hypothetical protein